MFDKKFDRRAFLGGAAAAGAFAAMPAFARDTAFAAVQGVLDGYVGSGKLAGVAAAVGRGMGAPQFLAAGTIARDSKRLVDGDTLWRVYSMTKPITGIAAMMLIEDGKVGLDQDIADFIPGFKAPRVLIDPAKDLASRAAARPITVRHLLTHTAGLGYTIVTKGPLLAEYIRLGLTPFTASRQKLPGVPDIPTAPSLAAFADRLATLPLIADPGARWSYSVSLDLLGRVIEVAAGMPFERFLQTRLFDPLGMASTWFQVPASELGRLTTNYIFLPAGPVPLDPGATSVFQDKPAFPFGGAGLVMSARDYDRFLLMLMGEGAIGGTRIMTTKTARLGMSNLLPPGVDSSALSGAGFGAGGRVTIKEGSEKRGIGTFGWGGAAATIGFVDRTNQVRAGGYGQYMPDNVYPFTADVAKAVYASL